MFPSNVLPNNKKFLKLQYKFWPLNSSHRGLHGSKISRVSHVRFFKLISHTSTLLRVIVKEIYINVSSHILTRKPDSVRHCKRGFTSNCAELIRSDRSLVHSQFPVLPCQTEVSSWPQVPFTSLPWSLPIDQALPRQK